MERRRSGPTCCCYVEDRGPAPSRMTAANRLAQVTVCHHSCLRTVSHLHIGLSQIVCPLETGTWQMGFKCRRNLLKAFGTPKVFQIFGTASGRSRESSGLVLPFRLHESLQRSGPVTEPQHTGPPEPPARLPQAFKSPSSQSPTRHYMHCLFIQTSNIP